MLMAGNVLPVHICHLLLLSSFTQSCRYLLSIPISSEYSASVILLAA